MDGEALEALFIMARQALATKDDGFPRLPVRERLAIRKAPKGIALDHKARWMGDALDECEQQVKAIGEGGQRKRKLPH